MAELDNIKNRLKSLNNKVRKNYNADIIGVFGSVAREENNQESDIDIYVRFKKGATLFDLVGLADFLEESLGRKVDIVSERGIRKEIKNQAMQDLVKV